MRIGIDIDGTLTNIVDSVIAYGQEYELINNLNDGILNLEVIIKLPEWELK